MVDSKELEAQLANLGVSALVDYLGEEKSKKLSDLGIEITAANLAKFIADESGIEVFKDPRFSAGVSGNASERCAN